MKRSVFIDRYQAVEYGELVTPMAELLADAMGLTDGEPRTLAQLDAANGRPDALDYVEKIGGFDPANPSETAGDAIWRHFTAQRARADKAEADLAALRAAVVAWERVLGDVGREDDERQLLDEMLRLARGDR